MRIWVGFGLLAILVTSAGCSSRAVRNNGEGESTDAGRDACVGEACVDPYAPCTDPQKCCPEDEWSCPDCDSAPCCFCTGPYVWSCPTTTACHTKLPVPDLLAGWECTWALDGLVCIRAELHAGEVHVDSDHWSCAYDSRAWRWTCTAGDVPNPTNKPEGLAVWTCEVDAEQQEIECRRDPPTVTPLLPMAEWQESPAGSGTWHQRDENGGLPTGGSNWQCNRMPVGEQLVWICYGEAIGGGAPPGGGGWACENASGSDESPLYRCEHVEQARDYPPGGGWYACVKGSAYGGTVCTKVEGEPHPPGEALTPGQKCQAGERMWCSSLSYDGWAQVQCDEKTLTWKTAIKDGKVFLDCQEGLAEGRVPNTMCACYHVYFNPSCCERPDCIVPPGTNGQVCPRSPGGLCDYCDPQASECKEAGARCIVTNMHETFCGRDCASQSCPSGTTCMTVRLKTSESKQCVPDDFSCFR